MQPEIRAQINMCIGRELLCLFGALNVELAITS
jgi:hypothetical protein